MFLYKRIKKPIIEIIITIFFINSLSGFSISAEENNDYQIDITAYAIENRVVVSMGDSYSSGEGIPDFYGSRDTSDPQFQDWLAHRSKNSWPGKLIVPDIGELRTTKDGENPEVHWYFVAASGAVTYNINDPYYKGFVQENGNYVPTPENNNESKAYMDSLIANGTYPNNKLEPQKSILETLKNEGIVPDYITLTLGGNDVGFQDVITNAAIHSTFLDPNSLKLELLKSLTKLFKGDLDAKEGSDQRSVAEKLRDAYRLINETSQIGDKKPCILVAGYPHLLNDHMGNLGASPTDLAANTHIFTEKEARWINKSVDIFDDTIKKIVENCNTKDNLNIKYIDVRDAFYDHEAYTADPWINGVFIPARDQDLDNRFIHTDDYTHSPFSLSFNVPVSAYSVHPNENGAIAYAKCVQDVIDEIEGIRVTKLLVNALDSETYELIKDKEITITFSNPDIVCKNPKQILNNEDGYATFYVSYDYGLEEIDSDVIIHVDGYKDYFIEEYPFKKKTAYLQSIQALLVKDNSDINTSDRKTITFGNYGGEDIDWIVLDENEEGMFLVSEKILDAKEYNPKVYDLTWSDSELREWLNEDFYNDAFNSEEKKHILKTHVKTIDNPEVFYAKGGNDTDDFIFLLSFDELDAYFGQQDDIKAEATDYAIKNGANPAQNNCCFWWLRTPGSDNYRDSSAGFMFVNHEGEYELYEGLSVYTTLGVRPAMKVNFKQDNVSDINNESDDKNNDVLKKNGEYIVLGHYEQDGNTENGLEPIEWQIVKEEDGKILLLSRYVLDADSYNDEFEDVTWENCTLRSWLNNEFYETAFNKAEKNKIITVELSNPDYGGKDGGNDTYDNVFCLSMEEVLENFEYEDSYYEDILDTQIWFCNGIDTSYTEYGLSRSKRLSQNPYPSYCWWLRSPGCKNGSASTVGFGDSARTGTWHHVYEVRVGIRPAICINSESKNDTKEENAQINENVKIYNYNGADFLAVKNLSEKYCFQQATSKQCTKCSAEIIISLIRDEIYKDIGWNTREGCTWKQSNGKSVLKKGYRHNNAQDKRNVTGQMAANGIPSAIRLGNESAAIGHTVAVVGVKKDADLNAVTDDDLLIIDPGTATIKILSELKEGSTWHGGINAGLEDNDWSVFIPAECDWEGFSLN